MKLFLGIAVAASLLLLPAVANAQAGSVDTKADIQKLVKDWMNAYNDKDVPTIVKMYDDNATLSGPIATDTGHAAIEASFKKIIAAGTFAKIDSITVDQSRRVGDLDYAMGAWTADMKGPEGRDVPVNGHWLAVYEYRDGHYLCLAHVINMMPPSK